MTKNRKRKTTMEDPKVLDVTRDEDGKLPEDAPAIKEYLPHERMPEDVLSEQAPEPEPEAISVKMVPPFTVNGSGIFDGSGRRIAICGFDHNREKSGPSIAQSIAAILSRTVK